jgi:hypothetical protein
MSAKANAVRQGEAPAGARPEGGRPGRTVWGDRVELLDGEAVE